MSRKHAPPPDADWLTVAKAISWSLHRARQNGDTPVAIVMDPAHWAKFRKSSGGSWDLHRPSLFDLPVEIDRSAQGWAVRVKPPV
jgi:hypothetical protein